MDWLAQNWIWVLIGILFIGMHLFGHGGHGGHGDGAGCGKKESESKDKPSGHQH